MCSTKLNYIIIVLFLKIKYLKYVSNITFVKKVKKKTTKNLAKKQKALSKQLVGLLLLLGAVFFMLSSINYF